MSTLDRQAAWASYVRSLGSPTADSESLEATEIDFKAGYDAGVAARDCASCALSFGRSLLGGGLGESESSGEERA